MEEKKIIDVDDFKVEPEEKVPFFKKICDAAKSFGGSVASGVTKIAIFCTENPITAALFVGVGTTAINSVSKAYCAHAEQVRRDRDYFDPRTGKHAIAKRKLDAYEQAYVDEQYNLGRSYVSILSDMELLK